MDTLRIVTLNVWNKSGPWHERSSLIRAELARLDADVIGLQEVLRLSDPGVETSPSPQTCQATQIAEGYGYGVAYAAACDYGNGLKFGNALLSRHPIAKAAGFALPAGDSSESRSLLYAELDTPHGPLPVFVTHLNWKLHHGYVRLLQVQAIVERIFELAPVGGGSLPPVLMGDFNADPESDEIRYLRGLKVDAGRSVYFADAWHYAGDGSLGATFDRRNHHARLSHEPPRRIDYVFVRGPDKLLRGEPIRAELAFATAGPSGDVWPSDHFGLVTDIVFSPRSP